MIEKIQEALRSEKIDGWLFFDHHRRDPLAYRILGLPDDLVPSRRWFYLIPSHGEPRKIIHKIELSTLDNLPGSGYPYSSWPELQAQILNALKGLRTVAMQYSPYCAIPYISFVDAGTVEFVRASGVEVVSSANLIQEFEARWSEEQFQLHVHAGKLVDSIRRDAFNLVGERLRNGHPINEYEVQSSIRRAFDAANLFTGHGPIVAVNGNASNPHYEPGPESHSPIKTGDLLLIDLWVKLNQPLAVYYDITWTGFCGDVVPNEIQNVFQIVRDARSLACKFVDQSMSQGKAIFGFQVDDVARGHISNAGYGENFFHRTGHSIGLDVHGTGANMDNLECHDDRRILPGTCFSVEPGIYLPNFGVRSEVNVFVQDNKAVVTGERQEQIVRI